MHPVEVVEVELAGCGTTLTLIGLPPQRRDPALSHEDGGHEDGGGGAAARAVALRATLPHAEALTAAERALLAEWLDRVATA